MPRHFILSDFCLLPSALFRFGSMPSYPGVSMEGKPSVQEAVFIFQEYVKAVLYPVRHGVWVW